MRATQYRLRSPAGRRLVSPGSGGGAAFTPASPAGLVLWLDAEQGLFQERTGASATTPAASDDDPVGTWADRSGNGNYLVAAADDERPLLKLAVQNGRNVVRFDGTDDWLQDASPSGFAGETGQHIFVVHARSGTPAFGMIVVTDAAVREIRWNGAGSTFQAVINDGSGTVSYGDTSSGWHVFEYRYNDAAGTARVVVDGTDPVDASDSTDISVRASDTIDVGARGGTNFLAGDIGEILIYNRPLSDSDRSSVLAYLAGRWGTP